ncbi:MAG: hypothetical protein IPN99_14025 [Bacteroidetes bacterium]|jgi:hypothetical protein|nr:hypothetical protein [Bacteroidota bacterium]
MATKTTAEKLSTLKEKYTFQLCKKDKSQISTKQGATGFPILYGLYPICVALYPDKEGNLVPQTLRYIEGESSIVQSEQRKDLTKLDAKRIYFKNGGLDVTNFNPTLLEFLMNNPRYEGNPNRNKSLPPIFKEIDKGALKIAALNTNKQRIEAEALVVDMFKNDLEGAKALCDALNVNTDQAAALMEHDLLLVVARNPSLFLKQLSSQSTKDLAFVNKALKAGVIVMAGNTVTYSDGSPTGFSCPIGTIDVKAEFINWFSDKKGKAVFEQIKFRLANPVEQLK